MKKKTQEPPLASEKHIKGKKCFFFQVKDGDLNFFLNTLKNVNNGAAHFWHFH
jgi:hypothetical protein